MHVSVTDCRPPFRFLALLALGVALALSSCASRRGREPSAPALRDAEACLTREALLSGTPQDRERCISLLERFAAARGTDRGADRAVLQLCRFYMARKDFSAAYNLLLQFEDRYPESRERGEARLYLGICLYYLDDTSASLQVLHGLLEDPEAGVRIQDAGRYIAENYVKQGRMLPALTWYERCDQRIEDPEARRSLRRRVLTVVSEGGGREEMMRAEELFPDGFLHEAARLGTAASAFRQGEVRLAESRLREMAPAHLDDELTPFIQALSDRMAREIGTEVCTVGCLLPLSGRYGRYGQAVLDALVLGAGAFQDEQGRPILVRLLIRDTAGDRETGVERIQELAGNPEVVGVVGPLLAGVSQACAVRAQEAGLPMISLTQKEDVALVGDFVFQNGLTIRQQVETLVEYAMGDLGISRFALLYPADEYGAIARKTYLDRVGEMGGEVVSEVSYPKDETDFQQEIRTLLGEEYYNEMKRREEEAEKRDLLRRSPGASPGTGESHLLPLEEMEEEEPLVAPFEALFVPDQYRKASIIAPYLAFYDLNDVVLMGNNAWNSVRLLEEAGEYVRDAVFVDGFFAESEMPHVRRFVDDFDRAFDRKPRVLEAQGYDSLLILEDAFHQAHPRTREGVRDALGRISGYPGLSGATSFDEEGRAVKRLYLLTVDQNRIREIRLR